MSSPDQIRRRIAIDAEQRRTGARPTEPVRAALYDERQRRQQGLPPSDPVRRALARDLHEMQSGERPKEPVRARLYDERQARDQQRAAENQAPDGLEAAHSEIEFAQAISRVASSAAAFLGTLVRRH